jgi:hypothetical protein
MSINALHGFANGIPVGCRFTHDKTDQCSSIRRRRQHVGSGDTRKLPVIRRNYSFRATMIGRNRKNGGDDRLPPPDVRLDGVSPACADYRTQSAMI